MKDQTRNLNAHKAARMATIIWNDAYMAQNGGVMDFWDSLSFSKKNIARAMVLDIEKAREEGENEDLAPTPINPS